MAAFAEGQVPVSAGDNVVNFKATNQGLYMQVDPSVDAQPDRIVKLHGSPAFSNAFSVATPDSNAGASVFDYDPVNRSSEADRAISFYWGGASTVSGSQISKWGLHTVNTGGVSTTASRAAGDFSRGLVLTVAAGALNGIVSSRSWIFERNGNSYKIYQEDGAYTAANTITDRFGTPATPDLPGEADLMVAHPTDPRLYVAYGRQLFVYDSARQISSFTFPDTTSFFSDMVWVGTDLYFAYNGFVYKLPSGASTASSVATLSSISACFPRDAFA